MRYEITKLDENSVQQLVELLRNVFIRNINDDCIRKLISNKDVIDLIAKVGNNVIGHAMVEIRYDLFTNEKYFFLNYFCVNEDYRRNGIGQSLLEEIEKLATVNNIDYMKFTSGNKRVEAHQFYKNRGYIIRDTSVFIKHFNGSEVR